MKKLLVLSALCGATLFCAQAMANVFITVKNDTAEDCSLAFHARIDQTKWLTVGWYVFAAGEEAPVILDKVDDIHNVFVYHDCTRVIDPKDETREAWVLTDRKFMDEVPRDGDSGYEKQVFIRLKSDKFVLTGK